LGDLLKFDMFIEKIEGIGRLQQKFNKNSTAIQR